MLLADFLPFHNLCNTITVYHTYMLALILLIIFGLGMAIFATQNTGVVHIMLGSYLISGVPLYMLLIGALLLGILISWFLSAVNSFSLFRNLSEKDREIRQEQQTIHDLQKKNKELSLEIEQLKRESHAQKEFVKEEHRPSVIERIRHNLAI